MSARILIVDDERFIVEAVSQHLKDKGYDIQCFTDSVEALETIKRENFDLILTDLRMPEISGMDIARAVRAKNTDAMVIILTGYATLDSAIESVSLNVYAYLNKPFELRELGDIVERALRAQSLERENEALQVSIEKLHNDVSTLYEVACFLKDTDDWDNSLNFILDQLSTSLGITHSCLLELRNQDEYVITKTNFAEGSGLSGKISTFPWHTLEQQLSATEPTHIQQNNNGADILKALSSSDESLNGILFIPIRFRKHLMGFLVAFTMGGKAEPSQDKRIVLQILAVQMSTLLYQSQHGSSDRAEMNKGSSNG